ncbi:MAG: hypothetical protein ACYTG0_38780 [Planctomycetota bacterium]|jgi:hypothetical protein
MSTLLDDPNTESAASPGQTLCTTMAAARVAVSWFGTKKTLTPEQRARAADTFGAEDRYLSAAKRLLDTSHPAFKTVTAVKNRAVGFWRGMSLPYPEGGVRLIRQDRIDEFDTRMREFQDELDEAVRRLDEHYVELKRTARQRLGTLYNPADYPESLAGMFVVTWDFPSIEPPDYLRQLNPQLYEQQCRRIQERFNEAVSLAEQAFTAELAQLVSRLTERLSGQDDGKPKVFWDSAIGNLRAFFERFQELNVRSNEELDRLVADAQQIVEGVEPQSLRDKAALRQHVAAEMSRVQSALDGLLVGRPRRKILRRPR